MLKQPASGVLVSLEAQREKSHTGGVRPFTKTNSMGERLTVKYGMHLPLRSPRPRPRDGASWTQASAPLDRLGPGRVSCKPVCAS